MIVSLFLTFAKIGLFTFGGGYAMISLIAAFTGILVWSIFKSFMYCSVKRASQNDNVDSYIECGKI